MSDQEPRPTDARAFVDAHAERLRILVDAVVPPDEFPSASAAGALTFLTNLLAERPDWVPRVTAVLDGGEDSDDWPWFADIIAAGYYADPENGGNDGARSWEMVDWSPEPAGGWSTTVPVSEARRTVITPGELAPRYDAIVIGSGAGGGVAAAGLAESGRSVLIVEAGDWPDIAALARDQIRNPRSEFGLAPLSGPQDDGNPRVADRATPVVLRPSDPGWGNNAFTAGGGTRVYGAQAWRFAPRDFLMSSTYGVPDGSALADWPITYEDLEPFYVQAEWELGVSGGSSDGMWAGARTQEFPMGPIGAGSSRERLDSAATTLGFGTVHVPLLVNSRPYLGRGACEQCGLCVGFSCPVDAKNGSQNTMLPRAFATGNAQILLNSRAARLLTDGTGRVSGVRIVRDAGPGGADPGIETIDVLAAEVVVAAGAVESARLLLNSPSDREPTGIGNGHDQVGRHLQGHVYGGAFGVFDDVVEDLLGPGPTIATTDFRHGNGDHIGGGILANEFVATPANTYRYLSSAGLIPRAGLDAKHGMRDLYRRTMRIMGPIQEVTSSGSRVRVDPSVTDRWGVPVARMSGSVHPEDIRNRDFASTKSAQWLRAAGAKQVVDFRSPIVGPSNGQHQAGTLRMGSDPRSSVVDEFGRVWGHDNLRVMDGSVHVTNGGVNPVLTIFATAMRSVDQMVGGRRRG